MSGAMEPASRIPQASLSARHGGDSERDVFRRLSQSSTGLGSTGSTPTKRPLTSRRQAACKPAWRPGGKVAAAAENSTTSLSARRRRDRNGLRESCMSELTISRPGVTVGRDTSQQQHNSSLSAEQFVASAKDIRENSARQSLGRLTGSSLENHSLQANVPGAAAHADIKAPWAQSNQPVQHASKHSKATSPQSLESTVTAIVEHEPERRRSADQCGDAPIGVSGPDLKSSCHSSTATLGSHPSHDISLAGSVASILASRLDMAGLAFYRSDAHTDGSAHGQQQQHTPNHLYHAPHRYTPEAARSAPPATNVAFNNGMSAAAARSMVPPLKLPTKQRAPLANMPLPSSTSPDPLPSPGMIAHKDASPSTGAPTSRDPPPSGFGVCRLPDTEHSETTREGVRASGGGPHLHSVRSSLRDSIASFVSNGGDLLECFTMLETAQAEFLQVLEASGKLETAPRRQSTAQDHDALVEDLRAQLAAAKEEIQAARVRATEATSRASLDRLDHSEDGLATDPSCGDEENVPQPHLTLAAVALLHGSSSTVLDGDSRHDDKDCVVVADASAMKSPRSDAQPTPREPAANHVSAAETQTEDRAYLGSWRRQQRRRPLRWLLGSMAKLGLVFLAGRDVYKEYNIGDRVSVGAGELRRKYESWREASSMSPRSDASLSDASDRSACGTSSAPAADVSGVSGE